MLPWQHIRAINEHSAKQFANVHKQTSDSYSPYDQQAASTLEQILSADSELDCQFITPRYIREIISKLPKGKSPGQDHITADLLKNAPIKVIVQLYYIFKKAIDLAHFPNCWKDATILPIKKPNKCSKLSSSYRPISLLSLLGKILEKIILTIIHKHLADNHIIINEQFGFQQNHSTILQILRITEYATLEINKNRITVASFLDLNKAFDTVWHQGLIMKMHKLNFPLHIIKMIWNYINNRKFHVKVNQTNSATHDISAGVPQGSVLGPILFNIYLNDIPKNANTQLALFADDTAIYASSWKFKQAAHYVNLHLHEILEYLDSWKLKTNTDKTVNIYFSTKNIKNPDPIIINNHPVPWAKHSKYLGLWLDRRFTWQQTIKDRIAKTYGALRYLRPLISSNSKLDTNIKLLLYKTCARPILTYGNQIWSTAAPSHRKAIQRVQNKFLKIILDKPREYPTIPLHQEANIELIQDFINRQLQQLYKPQHANPLISSIGNYNQANIPLKITRKTPRLLM